MALVAAIAIGAAAQSAAETWRGIQIAEEYRCSAYNKKRDYAYPQSVEREIVRDIGGVYGPYTGTCFGSTRETDIEHIVAASEAHDSGLCAASSETRRRFARDSRNLTLAAPSVNRHQKSGKDAAEWMPPRNRCWFAGRVIEVRQAYGLTVDRAEADALDRVLSTCESTEMVVFDCTATARPTPKSVSSDGALELCDDNGRIMCKEAPRHDTTPAPRGYQYKLREYDSGGGGKSVSPTHPPPFSPSGSVPNKSVSPTHPAPIPTPIPTPHPGGK